MATSAKKIQFPYPVLTPIATSTIGPNHASISIAQNELNSNSYSVSSYGGSGEHGHLALTQTPDEYQETAGCAFLIPVNPPMNPVHESPTPTAPQITEGNRKHLIAQTAFRTYKDTDKALRNMLIDAVPDIYLRKIKDKQIGYSNVTCLQVLTHLWDNYGVITQAELDENQDRMRTPWHPPMKIEALFAQLSEGENFAEQRREKPPVASVIRIGYNLILNTGLFELPCYNWRIKPDTEKTMDAFHKHFLIASLDQQTQTTSSNAGFHSANQVSSSPAATAPPASSNRSYSPALSYCWTHGTIQNIHHTSATCMRKSEGHQDAATLDNQMGGNTKVWSNRA